MKCPTAAQVQSPSLSFSIIPQFAAAFTVQSRAGGTGGSSR